MFYYNIIEIFGSIDGEGKRTGQLTTFIRVSKCNGKCWYCDTKYSFDPKEATKMSLDEILQKVKEIGYKNITLTGGEPLIQLDIRQLINALIQEGYTVNVETNGSIDIATYKLETKKHELFFTVDYKSISSGMNDMMNIDNFRSLDENDVVKFVVGTREDMEDAVNFMSKLKDIHDILNRTTGKYPQFYFSPVFGQIEPKEIVEFMKEKDLQDIKLQVQLHKIIYPVDMRGV